MKQESEMLIRVEERLNHLINKFENQITINCVNNHKSLEKSIYLKLISILTFYVPAVSLSILKISKILGF